MLKVIRQWVAMSGWAISRLQGLLGIFRMNQFWRKLEIAGWMKQKVRFSVGQSGRAPSGSGVYLGAYKKGMTI